MLSCLGVVSTKHLANGINFEIYYFFLDKKDSSVLYLITQLFLVEKKFNQQFSR